MYSIHFFMILTSFFFNPQLLHRLIDNECHIAEREKKNRDNFFKTYPDLEHELIVDQE